jgi:glutamate/tyrosine decarboxylase-like PLP-dependent enzyme
VTERGRRLLRGIERADSVGLDPHKWLFQPYEVGALLVKDVRTLEHAFEVRHDILQDTVWGANHPNLSDRNLQLSRSFRALKVWMSIQTFGMAAFRRAVSKGMELAARAEQYVRESPTLELPTPASLGIVCFRVNPSDADPDEEVLEQINRKVLARIFWEDRAFLSSTLVHGTFALRLCIINHTTTWDDVRETLEAAERFGTQEFSRQEVPR